MPITTSPQFASLAAADLRSVQGGCGKKCCPQPQPQAAPQPAPPPPSGDVVSTNVQISGYGAAQ
jgi:hypothetical protein